MNNFDSVASFYDRLSKLIFGKAMKRSQTNYLPEIMQGANILILGGGTGWLLRELFAVNPNCKVWYIDASAKMIDRSKKAIVSSNDKIVFIHGTEDSIPADVIFDVVIAHFYLDLFPPKSCHKVVYKIRTALHSRGILLICDFVNTTWWHGVMLRIMYRFFKLICGIESSSLPQWKMLVEENGFAERKSRKFFGGFIKSTLFQ